VAHFALRKIIEKVIARSNSIRLRAEQVVGLTLKNNAVSIEEAYDGKISCPPDALPAQRICLQADAWNDSIFTCVGASQRIYRSEPVHPYRRWRAWLQSCSPFAGWRL